MSTLFGAGQSDALGREWREEEPTGAGTWTRRGSSDVFDASWTPSAGNPVTATLEIGRTGYRIAAVRTQSEGRCVYQGAVAADEKSVRGTYTCSWAPGAYAWNAAISESSAQPAIP